MHFSETAAGMRPKSLYGLYGTDHHISGSRSAGPQDHEGFGGFWYYKRQQSFHLSSQYSTGCLSFLCVSGIRGNRQYDSSAFCKTRNRILCQPCGKSPALCSGCLCRKCLSACLSMSETDRFLQRGYLYAGPLKLGFWLTKGRKINKRPLYMGCLYDRRSKRSF